MNMENEITGGDLEDFNDDFLDLQGSVAPMSLEGNVDQRRKRDGPLAIEDQQPALASGSAGPAENKQKTEDHCLLGSCFCLILLALLYACMFVCMHVCSF